MTTAHLIVEKIFRMDGKRARYREYVYRVPVRRAITLGPPRDIKTEYAMAVDGWDSNPIPQPPEVVDRMDVKIRWRRGPCTDGYGSNDYVQIWLLPTKYTRAKEAKLVDVLTITSAMTTFQIQDEVIARARMVVQS